jgi:hypothetical protein
MSDSVIAQVVLRSSEGSSTLDPDEPITAENVEAHQLAPDVIEEATEKFRDLGFEVLQTSEIGVTIAGPKARYEEVFDTVLEVRAASPNADADAYEATEPVRIPEALSSIVEDLTFPVPPEFY